MRVPLFTTLVALVAGTGLAAAQAPATAPAPSAPATAPAVTAAEPGGPALPAPTPINPPSAPLPVGPSTQVPGQTGNSPVAAWQSLPPGWSPGAPVSDLAHFYNVPYHGPQGWFGVDYLMYWISPGPITVPLVNTT